MKKYQTAILILSAIGFAAAFALVSFASSENWPALFNLFLIIAGMVIPPAYMSPWLLSLYWNRPQSTPIFFLNAAFGWTALGWIGSLIWACITPEIMEELSDG